MNRLPRKTCLTIGFTLLAIACVAGIVVGIIVATTESETHKLPEPTPTPRTPKLITMTFNLGYRSSFQRRFERSSEQKNAEVDNTQQLLELVIDQIADDLNSGNAAIQLVPYAEEVIFDLIPNRTFTVDETLSAINRLFQRQVPLENDPNQYTSLDAFKLDSKQTGPILDTITANIEDVLLVGLNQTDEMRSAYGLNSSRVQVVPDGMNQVSDIVNGFSAGKFYH
ncbi:hypothetical protein M3Y96_00392800 [Aphelenchoides besseyi]|nr:hypothetical protein M3Y96_00392800 [Aphelenchoides besseyi]